MMLAGNILWFAGLIHLLGAGSDPSPSRNAGSSESGTPVDEIVVVGAVVIGGACRSSFSFSLACHGSERSPGNPGRTSEASTAFHPRQLPPI